MTSVSPATQRLAARILAFEATRAGTNNDEAMQVCERLRTNLSKLSGPDAYSSLLLRALTLARRVHPALELVAVQPDGALSGLDQLGRGNTAGDSPTSRAVLVSQLLGLVEVFVGETLMRRITLDAWPEILADGELPSEEIK